MANNLVFKGNVKVTATPVSVGDIRALVIGNEYIPTNCNDGDVAAVYAIDCNNGLLKFKVAAKTPFDSEDETQFVNTVLTEAEGKRRFVRIFQTQKAAIAKALKEADNLLKERKVNLAKAAEEKAAAKKAAEEKAAEEKAAEKQRQAERDAAAKERRANLEKEALAIKAELEKVMDSISVNATVYSFDGKICGTVTEIDKVHFGYKVKITEKKEVFLAIYNVVAENEMVDAVFTGIAPSKLMSRQGFKKRMETIDLAQKNDIQVFDKIVEKFEYQPEFSFKSGRVTGANRNEDGQREHFSLDVRKVDGAVEMIDHKQLIIDNERAKAEAAAAKRAKAEAKWAARKAKKAKKHSKKGRKQ